ncbi:MAG: ABC transporter transmembrane domain-containing protein [Actinomycetota bacterium]|nr:ABC transporter transmembrane domain-containing protein [Actinomycetota bacterium]
MTETRVDLPGATAAAAPKWRIYEGDGVRVHAAEGSYASRRATADLHDAERVVKALEELLAPPAERRGGPVKIYLADAAGLATDGGVDQDAIVRIIEPDAPVEPVARPLTRVLVRRWFGANPAAAAMVVVGIAGVVDDRAGTGELIAEADQWVQGELEAGRTVSIFPRGESKSADEEEELDPVAVSRTATSFTAFLLRLVGDEPLRTFLAAYDPGRRDQAAQEAYQRPLGALEEAWLTSLRSTTGEESPYKAFLRHVRPLLRPFLWREVEVLLYALFNLSYTLAIPLSARYLIDHVIPSKDYGTLGLFIGILGAVYIVNAFIGMRRAYVISWINQGIVIAIQEKMFAHLQRLSHDFYGRAKIGDVMARLTNDLYAVEGALMQVAGMAPFLVLSTIAASITLLILSPLLGALVVVVIPLFTVSYLALRRRLEDASFEHQERAGELANLAQENLSAQAVVKAYGLEDRSVRAYRGRLKGLLTAGLRMIKYAALFETSTVLAITAGQLVVLGVGSWLVMRGSITIGTLIAFIGLLPSLFQPIAALSGVGQIVQMAAGSFDRISELLAEPVTVDDESGAKELPSLAKEIRIEGVSFGYSPEQIILHELDLTIPAGADIAVVGPSGCGKSTLLNLLLRFWDPQEGRVLFDGQDLREVTLDSLRNQIGLVFQDTFVFDTTVRENIAIGKPDATNEEIVAAVKGARLEGFVESLPTGYDSVLGERGVRMSGGQRQRLAIARALLRDPRILILDEATSALDAQTEKGIIDTLAEAAQGRTTITITHRLSMAATADHIFVLEQGRLVEQGTHDELRGGGGLYQRLYDEQSGFAAPSGALRIGVEAERLRAIPLFSGLAGPALESVAKRLMRERFAADEEVVRRGEPGDKLYIVARGELEVLAGKGPTERRVNVLNEGDYFGEMALLSDEPRAATVRTTAAAELFSITQADFNDLLEAEEEVAKAIAQAVASRRAALEAAVSAA